MANDDKVNDLERYKAALALTTHSENVTWLRLGSLITLSAIAMTGWGLLKDNQPAQDSLAFYAGALNVIFVPFMMRSRAFVDLYAKEAKRLEGTSGPFFEGGQKLPLRHRLSATYVAPTVPLLGAFLFGLLVRARVVAWICH